MKIEMIGIDHTRAPLDVRQKFSFTKRAMGEALTWLKEQPNISGAVLLSTCNRMELWLSRTKACGADAYELLCGLRSMQEEGSARSYFMQREGQAAVEHLFRLAGGLESRIVGEDQILAQVKEAAAFSREQKTTDQTLEVLFRMAVTAGKQVKAQAPIRRTDYSAAHQALEALKAEGYCLAGKRCLVIGNGQMGQLAAAALLEEGAQVTMTLRQYHSGGLQVPPACASVNYKERYQTMAECDLVISATASPNLTVTKEAVEAYYAGRAQTFIDLAVPRDIEASVGGLPAVSLYDIDSFHMEAQPEEMRRQIAAAEQIIGQQQSEFLSWAACRELIPKVHKISSQAAQDAVWRTGRAVQGLKLAKAERVNLEQTMEEATAKVVGKLLFGLRDSLDAEAFRQCLEVLEEVYS